MFYMLGLGRNFYKNFTHIYLSSSVGVRVGLDRHNRKKEIGRVGGRQDRRLVGHKAGRTGGRQGS